MIAQLEGLLAAYGFEVSEQVEEEHRVRYRAKDTFIDVWHGRKGETFGFYNRHSKQMQYRKNIGMEELEDYLIKMTK